MTFSMVKSNPDKRVAYFWLDIETTGLYGLTEDGLRGESFHKILEVSALITDMDYNILVPQETYVIHHDRLSLDVRMDEVVNEMHTSNGLLDDVETSMYRLDEVEDKLIDMVNRNTKFSPNSHVMAGSSIHYDRFFISSQMPRLDSTLHYRNFDTSSLAMFFEGMYNKVLGKGKSGVAHRAADDILNSLTIAKSFKAFLEP